MDAVLAAIQDDGLHRLYLYWDEKRAGRHFPARRDIDPLDLSFILGWLVLLDVSYHPMRFWIRIYGSELAALTRYDMTGKYMDEHPRPTARDYIQKSWAQVIADARPIHGFYEEMRDGQPFRFESLRLPLSSDGTTIDMLLVGVRPGD